MNFSQLFGHYTITFSAIVFLLSELAYKLGALIASLF